MGEQIAYIPAPAEFKAIDAEKGTFTGYAAVFGNRDDGWDVIEPGAFKHFRYKRGNEQKIRVMAYHDSRQIIGEASVTQDQKGLKVDGRLNFKLPATESTFELMKDGSIDAMSVGFNILPGGSKWDSKTETRYIQKAELWEVSVVPFGMNSKARITQVKAGELQTPAEFEGWLRSNGFTRKQATAITARGFTSGQSDSGAETRVILAEMQKLIANNSMKF